MIVIFYADDEDDEEGSLDDGRSEKGPSRSPPLHDDHRPSALNLKKDDRQTPSPVSSNQGGANNTGGLSATIAAIQSLPIHSQLLLLQTQFNMGGLTPQEFTSLQLNLLLMHSGAAAANLEQNNNTSPQTVPPSANSPTAQAAAVLLMRSQVSGEQ